MKVTCLAEPWRIKSESVHDDTKTYDLIRKFDVISQGMCVCVQALACAEQFCP